MKYIVDIEALKNCLELIPQFKVNGEPYISLEIAQEMIDKFPKDEYKGTTYNATRNSIDIKAFNKLKT